VPDARGFTHLLCGRLHARGPGGDDEVVARLASEQEGIVARRQLLELGLSARAIDHRLTAGRLRPRFRGIYAVGHDATGPGSLVVAAVLAGVPSAAASHWTAAILRGVVDRSPGVVHVTCTRPRRRQAGFVIHRGALPSEDVAIVGGIPTTTMARTLLDLSGACGERPLRRMVKRAEFEGLVSLAELGEILVRYPRRQGRRTLARIVGDSAVAAGPTRSELEDRFLRFCTEHGLPMPETNAVLEVGGQRLEVDCLWREERLVVELDGYRAHGTATAFEDDRARDRALLAARWRPARVTWSHLHDAPRTLAAELRAALGHACEPTHA
jgi:hypothetical protein